VVKREHKNALNVLHFGSTQGLEGRRRTRTGSQGTDRSDQKQTQYEERSDVTPPSLRRVTGTERDAFHLTCNGPLRT
jgi:hypothetical protein